MSMGPLVSFRVGTWLIDECQIAFFHVFLQPGGPVPMITCLDAGGSAEQVQGGRQEGVQEGGMVGGGGCAVMT